MQAIEDQKDWAKIECPVRSCRAQVGQRCRNHLGTLALPHDERTERAQYLKTKLETGILTGIESNFSKCRLCGKQVDFEKFCFALDRKEPVYCSTECSNRDLIRRLGCCDKAQIISCVCTYAFDCPIHGKRHIGSHD